jgi:hypothetical protein
MKIRHSFLKGNNQIGTLLLDSLTAIAILAIVFAVSYPNYARAQQQAAIGIDVQQIDNINTATLLYENDHKGSAPRNGIYVDINNPGPNYMPVVADSPLGPDRYMYGSAPQAPAAYVIVDQDPVSDNTLLGSYHEVDGVTSCSSATDTRFLAEDPIHGVYCASQSNGD